MLPLFSFDSGKNTNYYESRQCGSVCDSSGSVFLPRDAVQKQHETGTVLQKLFFLKLTTKQNKIKLNMMALPHL